MWRSQFVGSTPLVIATAVGTTTDARAAPLAGLTPVGPAWQQRAAGLLGSCSTPRSSRDSSSNPLAPSSPPKASSGTSASDFPSRIYEWPTTRLPSDVVPPRERLRLLKALHCWLGPPLEHSLGRATLHRGMSAAASVRDGFPGQAKDTVSPMLQDIEKLLRVLCNRAGVTHDAAPSSAEVHATILTLIDAYDVLCPAMMALSNQMAEAADVWDSFAARPYYYSFQVNCGFRTVNGDLPPLMRIAALRAALGSLAFCLGALHQFMRAIHVAALGGDIRGDRGAAGSSGDDVCKDGNPANPHKKTWALRGLLPMRSAVETLEAVLRVGLSHLVTIIDDTNMVEATTATVGVRILCRLQVHWRQLFEAARAHAEPQRRLWAYGIAWGAGLAGVGLILYRRRGHLIPEAAKWLQEAKEFTADFTQTHLTNPARNIWHELYNRQHPTLGKADTIKIDLQRARSDYHKIVQMWETAARASVVQYGSAEEAAAIAKLTSLQLREARLEEQVVDPVKSIVMGDLLQLLLVEMAEVKVDALEVMGVLEDLIKDNNLNLEVASIMPLFMLAATMYMSLVSARNGLAGMWGMLRAREKRTLHDRQRMLLRRLLLLERSLGGACTLSACLPPYCVVFVCLPRFEPTVPFDCELTGSAAELQEIELPSLEHTQFNHHSRRGRTEADPRASVNPVKPSGSLLPVGAEEALLEALTPLANAAAATVTAAATDLGLAPATSSSNSVSPPPPPFDAAPSPSTSSPPPPPVAEQLGQQGSNTSTVSGGGQFDRSVSYDSFAGLGEQPGSGGMAGSLTSTGTTADDGDPQSYTRSGSGAVNPMAPEAAYAACAASVEECARVWDAVDEGNRLVVVGRVHALAGHPDCWLPGDTEVAVAFRGDLHELICPWLSTEQKLRVVARLLTRLKASHPLRV